MSFFINFLCSFIPSKNLRHKIRFFFKINSSSYKINTLINKIDDLTYKVDRINEKKEVGIIKEILYSNIFRDTISSNEWIFNKSFSFTNWAISYQFAYFLCRILNDIKPNNIIECGLGQSSKITIQYAEYFKKNLIIFEGDRDWYIHFSSQFQLCKKYTKICDVDFLNVNGYKTRVYANYYNIVNNKKFDLLLIDGPLGSERYSRYQLIDFINYIDFNNFIIVLDDANRKGEQDTIKVLENDLIKKNIKFVSSYFTSYKTFYIICSPNYKFLLTL